MAGTARAKATPGTPASHLARFIAFLLDMCILLTLWVVIAFFIQGLPVVEMLAAFSLSVGYYAYFHATKYQATPGKRIMFLYVVDKQLKPLSPRRSLERALAYSMPSMLQYTSVPKEDAANLIVWMSLIWFMPIFYTLARTGVHDMLCRTRVLNGRVGE